MNATSPQAKIQIDKAMQVYKQLLCNPEMTQAQACTNIGIDPKTYRKWIATQDEALNLFEQTRIEQERIEFSEYLTKKTAIIISMIDDAMKSDVSITERIRVLEYIDERIEELSDRYHTVDVETEKDFLSGPKQVPGISRMANKVSAKEAGNDMIFSDKDRQENI